MKIAILSVGLALFMCQTGHIVHALDEPSKTAESDDKLSPEEAAVRKNAEAFVEAFNKADAESVAALFTSTGQMSVDGEPIAIGREQIEKAYAGFFEENPATTISVHIDSIKLVGPNLAVERGTSQVTSGESDAVDAYTVVHVKQDGKWLTATADVKQQPIVVEYDWKQELAFLEGQWVAKKENWRVESTIEWVANGNFLRRKFDVVNDGKVESSGVQVIGWDPREGTINSWNFGGEGGHGRGWWQRDGDNWVIETEGTTPAGDRVQATNIITLLGSDAFRWQSTNRSVNRYELDDTESILVKRVKEK